MPYQPGPSTAPSPNFPPLAPLTGRKKALLIGINLDFHIPSARLNGPIADVQQMIPFLQRYGFQNFLVLTDDQAVSSFI